MHFLEALKQRVLVSNGAMGTMLQNLDLPRSAYGGAEYSMLTDILTLSRPLVIQDIHQQYLQAGANVILTNTFGSSKLRLQEYNFKKIDTTDFDPAFRDTLLGELAPQELVHLLNKTAAHNARQAVQNYQTSISPPQDMRPIYVCGCIGPSNWVLSSTKADLKRGSYAMIVDNFYHQALGLIDGGVDLITIGTQQDILELKATIHGVQTAMAERKVKLPLMAHVTVNALGKMQIFHTDILAALTTVQNLGIDVFGVNCSIGPDHMESIVKVLSRHSHLPISIVPNAGLPESRAGRTVFKLGPKEFAVPLVRYVKEYGLNLVGGCCGTTPAHIRELVHQLGHQAPVVRSVDPTKYISGPQNAVSFDSSKGLIKIGERLNVRGSKKVRDAVEGRAVIDFDTLHEVARDQFSHAGLQILDVCMDSNVVKTEDVLVQVIQELTTDFLGALCVDSFSVDALVKAVEVYPGRPMINSISLEDCGEGNDKIDAVVGKTRQHHPVYLALCASSAGPAQLAVDKFKMAVEICKKCQCKYHVGPDQLVIDVGAFPIGSESEEGLNFAVESLNAIPLIKAIHPDLKVSIGVGNLTNGLAKKPYMRRVITSVFMDMAIAKGIDLAIINPDHYVSIDSLDYLDVELARKIIFDHDMSAFARLEEIAETKKGTLISSKIVPQSLSLEESICHKIKEGLKHHESGQIKNGSFIYTYHDAIVPQVAEALKIHAPLEFVSRYLMQAMLELGTGFEAGDISLPHLLKSADVMKSAMSYVDAFIQDQKGTTSSHSQIYKGTVVLGTVYQDVHSIGKDLAKTLFENYGFRVFDLGVQVSLERFVEAVRETKADAVGMSALLVQTSNHMVTVARLLKEAGLDHVDILVGGAPVNMRHAAFVSLWGQSDLSQQIPNVFYCQTAMDGVNILTQLLESPQKRQEIYADNLARLQAVYKTDVKMTSAKLSSDSKSKHKVIPPALEQRDLSVCFSAQKIVLTLSELAPHLDRQKLFSLNWKYGGVSGWPQKGVAIEDLNSQLDHWLKDCEQNNWIVPQALLGLFPCQSDGDEVVVYDPQDIKKEIARLATAFSLAQSFVSKSSDRYDIVGFQIATAGAQTNQQLQIFKDNADSESLLLLQGLADRVAEDMAEYVHQWARKKVGVDLHAGARFSPGYPALKDVQINRVILDVLDPQSAMGITLTEAGQFSPTSTTSAVICFNQNVKL